MQRLPKLIEATALNEAINTFKTFEGGGRLRVLSCVFLPANRPTAAVDPEYFIKFYGKFEYQAEREHLDNSHSLFLMGHIPKAIYCDLNRATFPSPSGHDKYAVYPAAVFQNYAQLLGLNSDDHLVFYGGQTAGMLLASRLYWLFRAYGHSGGLSLLNGGFREWVQRFDYHNTMIEPDPEFHLARGNWTANTEASSGTITFEELTTNSGKTLNTEAILLDARPRAQFEGQEPFDPRLEVSSVRRLSSSYKFKYKTHFDPTQPKPVGCRLPGALNIPAPELFNSEGKLKGPEELKELVQKAGLDIEALKKQAQEKPLVTLCNVGMQASLLATVLDIQLGLGERTRVYNGSMLELKARAPELIGEGSRCLEDKEDEWDDEDDNRKYYYRSRNQMH